MKKITIFEAEDGTRFNTEQGCLKYEAILAQVTAALEGVWHPGADNHLFNSGRKAVEHPKGTRQRVAASLLPIFREAIQPRKQLEDGQYLEWLDGWFYSNSHAWHCLRMAHNRLMSMDAWDREWCDPVVCREESRWIPVVI